MSPFPCRTSRPPWRAVLLLAMFVSAPPSVSAARFNDTGLTSCLVDGVYKEDCAGTGQDAAFGRDATKDDDVDGVAGFKFIKIDADGAVLPNTALAWSCIKDRRTGLMWEVKSSSPGLRYEGNRYVYQAGPFDVRQYPAQVNAEGLCGQHDWRLPKREEADTLISMATTGNLFPQGLDRGFFNDNSSREWTTTCLQATDDCVMTSFSGGQFASQFKISDAPARLVRGPVFPKGYELHDGVATDARTGLTWRRCSEGQRWTGTTCKGMATAFGWYAALAHAERVAATTGEGWRLPNVKELMSITALPKRNPSIDLNVFPNTLAKSFWSSTIGTQSVPWFVDFLNGAQSTNFYRLTKPLPIRLVKDAN